MSHRSLSKEYGKDRNEAEDKEEDEKIFIPPGFLRVCAPSVLPLCAVVFCYCIFAILVRAPTRTHNRNTPAGFTTEYAVRILLFHPPIVMKAKIVHVIPQARSRPHPDPDV